MDLEFVLKLGKELQDAFSIYSISLKVLILFA